MLSRNLALVLPHPPSWDLRGSSGRRPAGPTPSGGVVGRSEDGRREPSGAGEETTPSGFSPGCPPGPQQQNPSSKIPGNSAAGALQKGCHENTAPGGGPWGALGVLGGTAGLGAAHCCQGCAVPRRSYTLHTTPGRKIAENQPSEGARGRYEEGHGAHPLCLERAPLREPGCDLATTGGTSGGIGQRTGKPPPRFGVG